jgi:membrane protein
VYARITFASMMERIKQRASFTYEVLYAAGEAFGYHRANRMAAAIAYRVMFAAAPLLLIALWVVAPILGSDAVVEEILDTVTGAFGPDVAEAVEELFVDVLEVGGATAIIGFALLFWTSSSLFLEMQHDLNDIFDVPYEYVSGLVSLAKKRGIGFLWAFGLGLSLIAIWLLNVVWRFVEGIFPDELVGLHRALAFVTPLLSFVLLPFVFGLVFQTMTVVTVKWRAVWWGGLVTAFMFLLAAYGIGLYFDLAGRVTAASVAGSFVVILLLAYLLSSVFLFGAEVTKVYDAYLLKGEIGGSRFEELTPPPEILVGEPPDVAAVPKVAVFAFLSGLFVAWRKNRR